MLFNHLSWFCQSRKTMAALLPSSCALCGTPQDAAICPACHQHYLSTERPRCRQCAAALPGSASTICGNCLSDPPAFDMTIVATDYAPPIDQLVLDLKFHHRLALAPQFADMLYHVIREYLPEPNAYPDFLVPVPLGAKRLQERGFNQALEIAKPLSRSMARPLLPRLALRQRETQAQSHLHLRDRQANLRDAFSINSANLTLIRGRHIGIVDDVVTTGETLNALARSLKRMGAARVTNLVFARPLTK